MESSKSTTRCNKAVASDPQVAHVNLMRHQRTDLHQASPSGNNILTSLNQRRGTQVSTRIKDHHLRGLIQAKDIKEEIDVQSVVIPTMWKILSVLPGSSSARPLTNMVIFQLVLQKAISF